MGSGFINTPKELVSNFQLYNLQVQRTGTHNKASPMHGSQRCIAKRPNSLHEPIALLTSHSQPLYLDNEPQTQPD